MNAVYEDLDEAIAEIEKLREQYRAKAELAENLKRGHNDQLSKNKEASSKLEKLAWELNEKDDEISSIKLMNDDLKSKLSEKESIIKHLNSAHDKLRLDFSERFQKCEEENQALALALDDANAKNSDQEQQIHALKREIEGVKGVLTVSQKKSSETERSFKELEGREDVCLQLEEDNVKFENQLKWKKEQFGHLEDAYKKLKNEFKMKGKEWEKEKGALLDDLSSLQTKLESQIRVSQDLQRRFEMCNGALAHAETKRKLLEAELSESRKGFDNICSEYDKARSNFETLATKRDQEIANLRSSLGTKGILYKEMEYQFRKLEQERQDLLASLKALQEEQIHEVRVVSSASKLQNKLKTLENAHKGCSANLKAKESEWHSQMEKLAEELNSSKSALECRDVSMNELRTELEDCDSLMVKLELANEEASLMLLVLKSEFSEAHLRFSDNNRAQMDLKNKEMEEQIHGLVEELEKKKAALSGVQRDLEEEREKVVLLSEKVQTLEELQLSLQKELDRLTEMLKDSSACKMQSEAQVMQIQSDLAKVQEALERATEELYEKSCEANEIEFELQLWKSVAEQLDLNLKQNHEMRREVEASLLAQMEVELNLNIEKESLSHLLEEKEKTIDALQHKLVEVNENMKVGEIASPESSKSSNAETLSQENLYQLVEEKDQRICDLQQLVGSLEHEFESSTSSFSSRLSKMHKEMNFLRNSWEKIKEAEVLKEMEIQEKNLMIRELENDLGSLRERLEQQGKTLIDSETKMLEMQVELEKKELEVHKLKYELEAKISSSEEIIEKLTEDNTNLSSENKNLVNTMFLLSEKIEKLSVEDLQLMGSLVKIVNTIDIDTPGEVGWRSDDDEQENIKTFSSPLMKKVEGAIHEGRSPFRAINN